MIFEWKVTLGESGLKLLHFLKVQFKEAYSTRNLKALLEKNCCTINGKVERFGSSAVAVGDVIRFRVAEISKEQTPTILFEDEMFLAINKPSGIASEDLELIGALGAKPLYLVHRLDKGTSGVLLLAKNPRAESAIGQLFRKRLIRKKYLAVVEGVPGKLCGKIDNYLGKISTYQGQTIWGAAAKSEGRHAITEWKVEKRKAVRFTFLLSFDRKNASDSRSPGRYTSSHFGGCAIWEQTFALYSISAP